MLDQGRCTAVSERGRHWFRSLLCATSGTEGFSGSDSRPCRFGGVARQSTRSTMAGVKVWRRVRSGLELVKAHLAGQPVFALRPQVAERLMAPFAKHPPRKPPAEMAPAPDQSVATQARSCLFSSSSLFWRRAACRLCTRKLRPHNDVFARIVQGSRQMPRLAPRCGQASRSAEILTVSSVAF